MFNTPPSHLYGLVDMGSNGIRFSITDLSPKTARCLPTVFQDRAGITLYDAQYTTGQKGPIPQDIIDSVLAALLRFKSACTDFGVPENNIRILATEATRSAVNLDDYLRQIKGATGWDVNLLPKEAEGRIGAMGVASSFSSVEGLVMDLGGGSTQITWMIARDGKVETSSKGSFSFPYGAAAMTRNLKQAEHTPDPHATREQLAEKMISEFQQAYLDLGLPPFLLDKARRNGLSLYLSGGGFRGWGYLLMSQHKVQPYPIPIINGFQVSKREFQQTMYIAQVAEEGDHFRVSKRRAAQVPAVAFVVNALVEALPMITDIRFCQGGVREGFLYDALDQPTKAMDPLPAATAQFASPAAPEIAELLWSALPRNNMDRFVPTTFTKPLIRALADMMYVHTSLPKESTSLAGMYAPITGILASAHGVSHTDRALLSLMLVERWPGEIPPPHDAVHANIRCLVTPQEVFFCNYLGAVAALIGNIYPAGRIPTHQNEIAAMTGGQSTSGPQSTSDNSLSRRIRFQASWSGGLGKKGQDEGVVLKISMKEDDVMTRPDSVNGDIETVEAVGKKKNRVGGKEYGYGVPIRVDVERNGV